VIERHLLRVAQESLRDFRVTVINGPRQSGKSTLAKHLVEGRGSYWSFDDESVRAAARLDPHGFVHPDSWLDEYRRVFKLFEAHLK
jgi:predicted AAA+ superfamily ATPase